MDSIKIYLKHVKILNYYWKVSYLYIGTCQVTYEILWWKQGN